MKSPNEMVRINNSIKVLDLLINKEMSRVDIAEETGLTKTTIGDIVKNFLNIGFIEEVKVSPNGVGRPSINLKIVKDFVHVIGVGILRDRVNGCLIDSSGEVLYNVDYPYIEGNPQINIVYKAIDELMRKAELTNRKVEVISFGVPGPLDTEKGIIKEPPKLPEFANFPLIKKIKEKYNVFACLGNDADMGAIGEKYYGKGKNLDSFIYILYDKGIGAGIIIDNHLYRGVNGYAGEIGQTIIVKNNKMKYFEDEYGIDLIVKKIEDKILKPVKDIEYVSHLSEYQKEMDEVINKVTKQFSIIILSLIHYFGISSIFIGGKGKYLGKSFLEKINETVKRYLFHKQETSIVYSDVDEPVISLGAAKYGLIEFLKELIQEKI
ncbi:ROK family transcriptional regulator [Petrotoga sp. SL27]|uniref:ROK family transcriptional regulator n=1 Tax=Petrotoga sp. SL27 TaxID=1445612 RepID=UPI000CDEAA15|nr:ROK family transcriptional regulator [Petrotoga sp. SL27]